MSRPLRGGLDRSPGWSVIPLAAALLWAGCGKPAAPAPPSVLLVTIDTLRADHVGCYGASFARTPALDGLARAGMRFEHAQATTPLTLPSHASLLTGLYPPGHGARNNGMYALPPGVPTLAEAFGAAGRKTGAFVSAYPVAAPFGLARGFEVYDDSFPATSEGMFYAERRGGDTVEAAARWLRSLPAGSPFFCWVHLFDPHANYDPPAPFAAEFAGRPYDGEVAYADSCLGRLLDLLRETGRDGSTIVLATADHGESLGEHGEATHGLFLYDATLRVPLVLRVPEAAAGGGRVVAEPVGLPDVMPTLLELAGVPLAAPVQGRSLAPLVRGSGGAALPARDLYAETLMPELEFGWAPLTALRRGSMKWIEAPRPELYDLSADPGETKNLADGKADPGSDAASLRSALATVRTSLVHSGVEEQSRRALSPRDVERLQSLGYVAGGGGAPPDAAAPALAATPGHPAPARRDPKDGLLLLNRLEEGKSLAREGRLDAAIGAFRSVLSEEPGNLVARWRLAEALLAAERPAEAETTLAALDDASPAAYWVAGLRARARHALGDEAGAIALYRRAAEREPDPSDAALRAGVMLQKAGRTEEARAVVAAALGRGARRGALFELAGDLAAGAGDTARAVDSYREALRREPGRSGAWASLARTAFASPAGPSDATELRALAERAGDVAGAKLVLGLLAYLDGRPADAVEPLRRARALAPADPDVAYFLGLALMDSGDAAGAEAVLAPLAAERADMFQAQRALGLLREKQGRREEAIALLRRALAMKPADGAAREALARLGG